MREIVLSLLLFYIVSFGVYSQGYYEWSEPFPITDSLSNNLNPELYYSWNSNYEYFTFLFWEKLIDSTTIEIWMDNLLDSENPVPLLSTAGIQYKNPIVMNSSFYPYPDTIFYLFYETNQNENWDIFYLMYLDDGTFSSPHPFALNPEDDKQLAVGGEPLHFDNYAGIRNAAAWICEGNLYSRLLAYDSLYFFTNQVIVDSSDCSQPIATGGDDWESIMYLRNDSSGKHVYQTYLDYDGNWNDPEVYYDSTTCENLSRIRYYYSPCWSTYIDTSWRIMTSSSNSIEIYDISSSDSFEPAGQGMFMGVKSWFPEAWMAVAYEEKGYDEIFMTEYAGSGNFLNFSNSGTMNRNPRFFHGETYPYNSWCWYDYLVWESYRNGHWQIWASRVIQCAGEIDEIDDDSEHISVYPNPFTNETKLVLSLESQNNVRIEIYDNKGEKVAIIADHSLGEGEHQLRWNSEGLPAGIYFLKMRIENKVYSAKLIKAQ